MNHLPANFLNDIQGKDTSLIPLVVIEGKAHTGSTKGFKHTFTINEGLDSDSIEATVIDGVLTVSVPYAEEVKPRKVEVKVK